MAGFFALNAAPGASKEVFKDCFFNGTLYQQHLNERFAGRSFLTPSGEIITQTGRGLFASVFREGAVEPNDISNRSAIGYCGPAEEPAFMSPGQNPWSLCFSGNIINRDELYQELAGSRGMVFDRAGDDVEIIAKLIALGGISASGIKLAAERIKGSFSLVILTKQGIYAAVSPDGRWPLSLGQKDGMVAVATEGGGFRNLGFDFVRHITAGEIIFLKDGKWGKIGEMPVSKIQICSFLWVYTAFPNARIFGIPASLVRRRLGACLAQHDIANGFIPHFAIPVPDSGRHHAFGYQSEFYTQLMLGKIKKVPLPAELILKYPYFGRSFTRSDDRRRSEVARRKILEGGESREQILEYLQGAWGLVPEIEVVVCEDSVVRGTQVQENLTPKLRSLGIDRVHIRASFPALLSHCPWGKTTKKGETLAERMPDIADRIMHLGVDSLAYSTIDDLVEAIGLARSDLCLDCTFPAGAPPA